MSILSGAAQSTSISSERPVPPSQRRVSRGGTYIYTYKEYDDDDDDSSDLTFEKEIILKHNTPREGIDKRSRRISLGGLRLGSTFKPWAEVSKINLVPSTFFDVLSHSYRRRSRSIAQTAGSEVAHAISSAARASGSFRASMIASSHSIPGVSSAPAVEAPIEVDYSEFEKLKLAKNLLNEGQLWGCFYVYPDLYNDNVSPVVRIREPGDVEQLVDGVLTRDMVTTCLTYLKRIPLLRAFVYIKLDIPHKYLTNIDVLQHYKYLVYLDMNSNLLTSLEVLTYLPYLQFLNVSYNRLGTVLEYENPQWFLTDVMYKFNSVKKIDDLTKYWSLSSLDLSHNNINEISGLENLNYLRRLDLSFNHITKLENLNHLRLTWLDLSYNNISSFEYSENTGLWTLMHLEYLNINENELTSLKILSRCSRLRELHARNNCFNRLLEVSVFMKQLKRLIVLDFRANGVCNIPGYKEVVIHTFPLLLSLDEFEIDPIEQRMYRMEMEPDIMSFATHRLLRLLYVEQLSRSKVSHTVPPADTTQVPLVVLVGCEGSGKGSLLRRIAKHCHSMVDVAHLHTTASFHFSEDYIQVSRDKFDDMILNGELLTYSEMFGHSYGLSREEAWIMNKVKIAAMDLPGALMLKLRGRKPYLILVYSHDKEGLKKRQEERAQMRIATESESARKSYVGVTLDKNTLQVMVSGRILVNGILNEIMMELPGSTPHDSAFLVESECSLFMDSTTRQAAEAYTQAIKLSNILDNLSRTTGSSYQSMSSLYHSDGPMDEQPQVSKNKTEQHHSARRQSPGSGTSGTLSEPYKRKSKRSTIDSGMHVSLKEQHSKSSHAKSVTFTGSAEPLPNLRNINPSVTSEPGPTSPNAGAECSCWDAVDDVVDQGKHSKASLGSSQQASASFLGHSELSLWNAFLSEIGYGSDTNVTQSTVSAECQPECHGEFTVPLESILEDLGTHRRVSTRESGSEKFADCYEEIHRENPGYFWDTVCSDDPNAAYHKMKDILRDIVQSQDKLRPMFDIDFVEMTKNYPHIEARLNNICKKIAPQRLFN